MFPSPLPQETHAAEFMEISIPSTTTTSSTLGKRKRTTTRPAPPPPRRPPPPPPHGGEEGGVKRQKPLLPRLEVGQGVSVLRVPESPLTFSIDEPGRSPAVASPATQAVREMLGGLGYLGDVGRVLRRSPRLSPKGLSRVVLPVPPPPSALAVSGGNKSAGKKSGGKKSGGTKKGKGKGKGRATWTEEEEVLLVEALEMYGRDWQACVAHLKSRKSASLRSHCQKLFLKCYRDNKALPDAVRASGEGYTLSGKTLNTESFAAKQYLGTSRCNKKAAGTDQYTRWPTLSREEVIRRNLVGEADVAK